MNKIQLRRRGKAWRTVATEPDAVSARWCAEQHVTPDCVFAVRVLDADGNVLVRWLPKEWSKS